MPQALWKQFNEAEIIDILNKSTSISDLTKNLGYHTRNKHTRNQINQMLDFYNLELPQYEGSMPLDAAIEEERICDICGNTFLITKKSQRTRRYCFECSPSTSNPKFKANAMKKKVIELKGGKCERCGYDKCIDALEFHHLDPSQKDMVMANNGASPSFEKYLEEAEKCILLCANCHREEHWKIRQEKLNEQNSQNT